MENNEELAVLVSKHVKYFLRFLKILPDSLSSHDTTRLTIVFFSVSGLDVLNSLHTINELSEKIIEWIYLLQVPPTEGGDSSCCGFQGSPMINIDLPTEISHYKCGHLAITYTGLCTLLILGDDLSRINRRGIISAMSSLQREDGNFTPTLTGSESDMRFIYCAACVSYILDDWTGYDLDKTTEFILNSINYDDGVGQCPELESHGGSTFCAIAALSLSNRLDRLTEQQKERLIRWLLNRQTDGFQGRPNKPVDTCYSFWICSTLKILGALELSCFEANRKYVFETQDRDVGGFSKWPDTCTDPFHTYFALGGLSLIGEHALADIMPTLNITQRAHNHLKRLHSKWREESS